MAREQLDIHQTITNQIIAALERGTDQVNLPWHRPGTYSFIPKNGVTGKSYHGINVLQLWASAELQGFDTTVWASYRQWQAVDAQVRKGEKATLVVFYKQYQGDADPEVDGDDGVRRVAKASWVFNAAQVDGWQAGEPLPALGPIERLERAEAFVRSTGAEIRTGGEQAYYRIGDDYVQMPAEELFRADGVQRSQDWYAVLTHELGHWSGAPHRLNRQFGKRFGDEAYAVEELTAEVTSAFLCAELGINPVPRADHANYIGHWLKVLKSDKKAVFAAAAKASEAAQYLLGLGQRELAHAA